MTPRTRNARERRAEARERRRSRADDAHVNEHDQDTPSGDGPAALAGDALKAAASAAALGAAVGAARALSARRRTDVADEGEEHEPAVASDATTAEADEHEEHEEHEEEREEIDERQAPQADAGGRRAQPEPQPEPEAEPKVEPASPSGLQTIVRRARDLLRELHGTDAEAVSSVTRTSQGWAVGLEVVELRRIPNSTDILATYEVELDGDGRILRFDRKRRYRRAEADEGGRR
jgi:gas vesicle protein GvpO